MELSIQTTGWRYRAGAIWREAIDQCLVVFEEAHKSSETEFVSRAGEHCATARTAAGGYYIVAREVLDDLVEVIAGEAKLVCDLSGREGSIGFARHTHKRAEAVICEAGQAHSILSP
ncbi:hypothetical protein GCM10011363_44560 [Marivita lacus]|uniref:Uncharacterized protein n=1 Tax=Marivita lacus TaxID=1323742 RepID=A0ABQ1LIE7_9RHOB|nr:hypothetical protein GCM10011363_44560 [Marivita lacus]